MTRGADVIYRNAGHFNSHAHVERDVYVFEGRLSVDISTHTLTWSVTQLSVSSQRQAYFNSHAHVERDRTRQAVYKDVVNFNSHAHVERDLKIIRTPRLRLKFQLTRSRGAWQFCKWFNKWTIEFQLTRSRGAWHKVLKDCVQIFHFNSHAHVERDERNDKKNAKRWYFNSHAHVERDLVTLGFALHTMHFNSHAHVERDVQGATVGKTSSNFNSHAHVERDENVVDMGKQILDFNSHAHVERDEVQMSFTEMQVKFQLTRSRGAWPI